MEELIIGVWEKNFFMGKSMSGYFYIIKANGTMIRKWGKLTFKSNWRIINKNEKHFLELTNESRKECLEMEILSLTKKELCLPSQGQRLYFVRREEVTA